MKKIVIIIAFCLISFGFRPSNEVKVVRTDTTEDTIDTSFLKGELNDSNLLLALKYYKVKHPVKVLAQAKLESNNYKSSLCRNKNNFLGLYNSKKKTYFTFKHWTDCIKAYKSTVEYRKRDGEPHYKFLRRIKYASNPHYIKRVKEIEKSLM